MDNNTEHLHKVSNESNQYSESCFACQSHKCVNNSNTDCNCTPNNCAQQPNDNGWLTCPESGKLCSIIDCPNGCKGDSFADNLSYIGNPYAKVQHKDFTPSIIVGAII